MTRELKNIIFSGAGFKGWAYIGAIRALNRKVPFTSIDQVIGVSAGAVIGLFYVLQINHQTLMNYFLNLKLENYIDIDIDSFLVNESIIHGQKYKQTIEHFLGTENVTFQELYNRTGKIFTTCAFNITQSRLDYFNKEITPDVLVIDAIMGSSALPILLPSYKINQDYYYDGAICNNCPCNLVDPQTSIAFIVGKTVPQQYNLLNLILSLSKFVNRLVSKENDFTYDILDEKYDNENINVNQSKDTIFNIYMNGYKNTKRALNLFFKEV